MSANSQIFVTSVSKAVSKARINGQLDLTVPALFNLYTYYLDFAISVKELGDDIFNEEIKCFRERLSELKYKYPSEICNYKTVSSNINNTVGTITNTAPTITNTSVDLAQSSTYTFTSNDFLSGYNDVENHTPRSIKLNLTGLSGTIYYQGIEVTISNIEIPVGNISQLTYERPDELSLSTSLTFRVSDNAGNSLYSLPASLSLSGDAVANQPATIGDNTIYVGNRQTTTLTLEMFTSQLTPPYNDPEGDLIDAIRIDEISTANIGKFLLNGIEIIEGQVITREDIIAGLFEHDAPDQDAINSDVINFSARDEGSGIWVQ